MADQNCRHLSVPSVYMPASQTDRLLKALPVWWAPLFDASIALRRRRSPLLRSAGSASLRLACFVAACYARQLRGGKL